MNDDAETNDSHTNINGEVEGTYPRLTSSSLTDSDSAFPQRTRTKQEGVGKISLLRPKVLLSNTEQKVLRGFRQRERRYLGGYAIHSLFAFHFGLLSATNADYEMRVASRDILLYCRCMRTKGVQSEALIAGLTEFERS